MGEGRTLVERARYTVGMRWGNHWTEVLDEDRQALVVRTHEASRDTRPMYADDYAPTDEGMALLQRIVDLLNSEGER